MPRKIDRFRIMLIPITLIFLFTFSSLPSLAQWLPGNDETGPTLESLTVSSPVWQADGTNTYEITFTASDAGAGVESMRVLINRKGANKKNRRGFFAWRESAYTWNAGSSTNQIECIGGGFAEKYNGNAGSPTGYGRHYSTLVGCSTEISGPQRTVTFTVLPHTDFGSFQRNDVAGWARDRLFNKSGWRNFDLDFVSLAKCGKDVMDPTTVRGCECLRYETFRIEVSDQPVTRDLMVPYISPVIVCTPSYDEKSEPHVVRIGDVTETSFNIWLQNPAGQPVPPETVSCMVIEEGAWSCKDTNFEARRYLSTQTDHAHSWLGEPQTYLQDYVNPVVVGQVMSANDPLWSVFWARGETAVEPPNPKNLFTGKHVGEDTVTTRANEEIGYFVFEEGHSSLEGIEIDASLSKGSHPYSQAFAAPPLIEIASLGTMADTDGAWAVIPSDSVLSSVSDSTASIVADEDILSDQERKHEEEAVARVSFFGATALSPPDQDNENTCERAYQDDLAMIPPDKRRPLAQHLFRCAVEEGLDISVCRLCNTAGTAAIPCLAICLASEIPDIAICLTQDDPPDPIIAAQLLDAARARRTCYCRRLGEECSDYYDVIVSHAAGLRPSGPRQRAQVSLYCSSDEYTQGPFNDEWSQPDMFGGLDLGECANGTYPADWKVVGGCVRHQQWDLRKCDDMEEGGHPFVEDRVFSNLDCGELNSCDTQPPCNSFFTAGRTDEEITCTEGGDFSIIADVVDMSTVSSVQIINEVYEAEDRPNAAIHQHTFTETGQTKTFSGVVPAGHWVTSRLELTQPRSGACTFTDGGSMYQSDTNVNADLLRHIECEPGFDVSLSVTGLSGQQAISASINFPSTGHNETKNFGNGQSPFSMRFPNEGQYTLALNNQSSEFACVFAASNNTSLSNTINNADVVHAVNCSSGPPPGDEYSLVISVNGDAAAFEPRPNGVRVDLTLGSGAGRSIFAFAAGEKFFNITAPEGETFNLVVRDPDVENETGTRISHCELNRTSGTIMGPNNPVLLAILTCRNFPGVDQGLFCPVADPGEPAGLLPCSHPLCNMPECIFGFCEVVDVETEPCVDCDFSCENPFFGPGFFGRLSSTSISNGILVADEFFAMDGTVSDPDGLSDFRVLVDGVQKAVRPVSGTVAAIDPITLDMSQLSDGSHTLTIKATDANDAVTIGEFAFQVDHSSTPTPPSTPNGVAASSGTFPDRVRVTWNSAAGADSYEVHRNTSNNSGTATRIAHNLSGLVYDDFAVSEGTVYYYWLKAVNSHGSSSFSAVATGSTETSNPCSGDVDGPSLTLTAPTNGSSHEAGNVNMSASASDPNGVESVQFYVDGSVAAVDFTAPFSKIWSATEGSHTLHAEAVDLCGNESSTPPITVTINPVDPCNGDGSGPTVSLTAPSHGDELPIGFNLLTASATDPNGVQKMEFYADGTLISTDSAAPFSYSWNAPLGTHTLYARAYDGCGNARSSSSATVTVVSTNPCDSDHTGPSINLTAPSHGSIHEVGSVNMSASANDPNGVESVQFYVDGSVAAVDFAAPYSRTWNATLGTHALKAGAIDNCGNEAFSSTVTVTINEPDPCAGDGSGPTVSITEPGHNTLHEPGTVTIRANASDPGGVQKVEFYVDNTLKAIDTTSAYSWFWADGTRGWHTVKVRAFDNCGNSRWSPQIDVELGPTGPEDPPEL